MTQQSSSSEPQKTLITDTQILNGDLWLVALCFAIALSGFAYILTILPGVPRFPEGVQPQCITGGWKWGLIATHVLAFALIPLAMRVFYQSLRVLDLPQKTIFASQLGLAFIMVAIASEIGWHVTQCWYYQNEFTMLNFMFYFFLISAFALWADGLAPKSTLWTRILNVLFAISLLVVAMLYPMGYEADNPSYKIPIYITLTLVFAVLTYRGYQLLKTWKIFLFPFFSVGVNLSFVFLLDRFGGDPICDPQVTYNALFHILHDLGGTEVGVAIFTALIYRRGLDKKKALLCDHSSHAKIMN
ncbi:MAG: hypothetical protein GVY17_14730 [Cyanobacteria bacterium]|jgi:hypothetical protein|nr:hypothetical protein [Cyanobacteria bacterium GSL.Bin21]